MLIIGTFEHSIELEQVLAVLENSGIPRNHILVILMDIDPKPPIQIIQKLRDLYSNGIAIGIACATASSVIGTCIGFILAWGPIFWGLTGGFLGFAIGFGLYLLAKKGNHRNLPSKLPEIIVIVKCPENQSMHVMQTMWNYRVLTVGQAPEPT